MNVVSSQTRWLQLFEKGRSVFDYSQRFPGKVHRLAIGSEPFFDGDILFGTTAWPLVSSVAEHHGDDVVHFLTIEPSAEYFAETTGRYGAFTVSASDAQGYRQGLFGLDVGEIAYMADVVAVFGNSARWGIWSERHIAGLVTAENPGSLTAWESIHGPFTSAEVALDDFLGMNIGSGPAAERFAFELLRNYGHAP